MTLEGVTVFIAFEVQRSWGLHILWDSMGVHDWYNLCHSGVGSARPTDSCSVHFYVTSPVFKAKKEKFEKNNVCGFNWLEIC